MYNVSNDYKIAIEKLSRETKVSGKMVLKDGTEIPINDKDIMLGTLNIDNSCVNGQDFELGSVYLGQLKMSLNTEIDRYKIYGAVIILSYFLKLQNGNYEEVPLGIYTIEDAVRSGKYISITAYDNMNKFDKNFVTTTNGSAYDLLSFCCDMCGMEMSQTQTDIDNLSAKYEDGTAVIFRISDNNEFSTFRDLISDVAMTLGGFATIDRSGKLVIKRFSKNEIELNEKHRKNTNISDYKVIYSGVQITVDDKTYKSGTDENKILYLNSSLWDTGTDDVKQSIADNILNAIKGIDYTPTVIDFDGDPSFDLGDRINYTGGTIDTDIHSYIMTSNWTYRNSQKVTAVGSNPVLSSAKTKTDKQIEKTDSTVKQNELKISTFQSSTVFNIDENNQLIVQIGINATTGAMIFQGQCIINVSKPGTFEITYELNGDTILFRPRQIAPYSGYYLINLYYPITTLSADFTNNWNVYLKSIDGGTGVIDTASIVANLIGSNLGAGKSPFTGIIDLNEKFTMTRIAGIEKIKFKDDINVETLKPTGSSINENFNTFKIGAVGLYDVSDNINVEQI